MKLTAILTLYAIAICPVLTASALDSDDAKIINGKKANIRVMLIDIVLLTRIG